jgi:hypothetical protein
MHLKMLAVFCKDVEVKYFNSSVGNVVVVLVISMAAKKK